MKINNEWLKPVALMVVTAMVIASIFVVVSNGENEYNIIPADTVIVNGQTYGVLDLLTDSGMEQTTTELSKFGSLEELNDIVGQEGNDNYYWGGARLDSPSNDMALAAADSGASPSESGISYSTTNTQVSGVDEGDIVKNDDKYAYIASSDRSSLFIIDAYPADNARIVSEILANGTIQDIYISDDFLIIIEQTYYFEGGYRETNYMHSDRPTIFVRVFDIADREEPVILRDAALIGHFSTSRVIDNNLYLIANHYNYREYENESQLPLPLDRLYYMEDMNAQYSLTNFKLFLFIWIPFCCIMTSATTFCQTAVRFAVQRST